MLVFFLMVAEEHCHAQMQHSQQQACRRGSDLIEIIFVLREANYPI